MISPQTIEKINDLPILEVVKKYHTSEIKKAGVNYVCSCPYHTDANPSFTISPAKNMARCFSCDTTAFNIGLVMHVRAVNYPEAIRMMAADFNITIDETEAKKRTPEEDLKMKELESLVIANSWAANWYHSQLLSKLEKYIPANENYKYTGIEGDFSPIDKEADKEEIRAIDYIYKRMKCSVELIKDFKIGYAPAGRSNLYQAATKAQFKPEILIKAGLVANKDGNFRDYFNYRPFMFPITSQHGNVIGFGARQMPWNTAVDKHNKKYPKFINTSDTALYKKSKVMYNLDLKTKQAISKEDKIYLVEGYSDKTSLWHINIKNVLIKSGTALTEDQVEILKKLTKNVCLIGDSDGAGKLSDYKSGEKLIIAGLNVTYVELPEKEDPDSFFESSEHFASYIKENEKDYIIDWRAIEDFNGANTIQLQKKIRDGVAQLLLHKSKEDRELYLKKIIKGTQSDKADWQNAIRSASFAARNKGLNQSEENDQEPVECDQSQDNRRKHDFYNIKYDKAGKPAGLEIDELQFMERLKSTRIWEFDHNKIIYFGFYTYTLSEDESEMIFVQLRDGKIKKVSINYIKRTFLQYIRSMKPYRYEGYSNDGIPFTKVITCKDLERQLIRKITILFEEKRLVLYPDKKIELLQDTFDKHYTFFKNCYVVSTKDSYIVNDYENLKEGYVWDDAVLDKDFVEPLTNSPGIFEKFVHDISGNNWDLKENKSKYSELTRYRSLLIAGGYSLHNFTDMERKAVVLTQGRLSEDDTAEGREGKTMFVESLGRYMLNKEPDESKTYVYIPGKDLKSDDKHKWMDMELNTTLVLYDDPPPYIQFEDLYNVAERSFKSEKKNKGNKYIKARVFITTNRPLERDSGSSRARSCVIELDSIYSADYTPGDKYHHRFFRDWTGEKQDEWNKFFKYVLGKMLPEYFKNSCKLLEPPSKNLYRNELLQKARRLTKGVDIIFWMDNLCRGDEQNGPFFKHTESYSTKDLYPLFLTYSGYKDEQRLKTNFTKILKGYFEKESIQFTTDRDSRGTCFKIISGLPEAVKLNQQYVVDFFNNGSGYIPSDCTDEEKMKDIVKKFNEKFNTSAAAWMLKSAVEKMGQEMPF